MYYIKFDSQEWQLKKLFTDNNLLNLRKINTNSTLCLKARKDNMKGEPVGLKMQRFQGETSQFLISIRCLTA